MNSKVATINPGPAPPATTTSTPVPVQTAVNGGLATGKKVSGGARRSSRGKQQLLAGDEHVEVWELAEDRRSIYVRNPNIDGTKEDVLYHLAMSTNTHDLQAMFGDVKFVCVGGSARRMEIVALYMAKQINYKLPAGQALVNISADTDRFAMYKVGPVLTVSHGMGISSFSIMMHELMKLLHYAKAEDVCLFRLGTSGGLGLEAGTVVVSKDTVDALFRPYLELQVLGKVVTRPASLDTQLIDDLLACSLPSDGFDIVTGTTMCTLDFYEGQARLDGAFCEYTEGEKMNFLREAYGRGVRNIEMESLCFAAMCTQADIRGAVICVTLLDRLTEDQINVSRETLKRWEERPAAIVARFIRRDLEIEK